MSLTKCLKYTSIGLVGFVAGAEILYHASQKRQASSNAPEINEIFFARDNENYKSQLVKNVVFVGGPTRCGLEILMNLILSARKSINVAIQTFTSNLLAWSLIEAKKNGVDVKCVVDSSTAANRGSKINMLRSVGVPVKIHSETKMNLNLCIIDVPAENLPTTENPLEPSISIPQSGIVIKGSLNWTREDFMDSEGNFIVTSNENVCQKSIRKFNEIWENSEFD
jgi:hypothetical protein